VNLRDYQTRAIEDARTLISSGCKAPVIVLPTGSGKTRSASALCAAHIAKGGKGVLWIAHRTELIEQAYDALTAAGLQCGAIGDKVQRPSRPSAKVQVAMIQTLNARKARPDASVVVYDECHRSISEGGLGVINHYKSVGAYVIGLTATPERSDGRGLEEAFDGIVVGATIRELTDRGILVPCEVIAPSRHLGTSKIAQSPVDAWHEHARDRRTLVFATAVPIAKQYVENFRKAGASCELVVGNADSMDAARSAILDRYKAGKIDVLVNCLVLTDGFDDPPTDCVIIARACGSPGMFLQIVGRALRSSPGKRDALLIDLPGVTHLHGKPDEDRFYSLDGKGIRRAGETGTIRMCRVCKAPLADGEMCGCGDVSEAGTVEITGDKLEKYAGKRRESAAERVATLARWLRDSIGKGHKAGAAMHKYKHVYSEWPTRDIQDAAWATFKKVSAA
jgi:DNA repair protein RadD